MRCNSRSNRLNCWAKPVSRALARAKEQVDRGQSRLARTTLRRAAEDMRREEEERRERYGAGVTALYTQEREIALAAYDGTAAAEAIVELARSMYCANATKVTQFLSSEAETLDAIGDKRGSNHELHDISPLSQSRFA